MLPEYDAAAPMLDTEEAHIFYIRNKIDKKANQSENSKKVIDGKQEEETLEPKQKEEKVESSQNLKDDEIKDFNNSPLQTVKQTVDEPVCTDNSADGKKEVSGLVAYPPPEPKFRKPEKPTKQVKKPPLSTAKTASPQESVTSHRRPIVFYPKYYKWFSSQKFAGPFAEYISNQIEKVRSDGARVVKSLKDDLYEIRLMASGLRIYVKFTGKEEKVHVLFGSDKSGQSQAIIDAKKMPLIS